MNTQHETLIRRAIELAQQARNNGNHPFGALLTDPNGTILLEAQNTVNTHNDCTGHAETNLVRNASQQLDKHTLKTSILYTSTEPCAMCAGAIYWSGISTIIYGLPEHHLLELTGNNEKNLTLSLPCREVFAHGQRSITVIGPVLEDEARAVHEGFWQ